MKVKMKRMKLLRDFSDNPDIPLWIQHKYWKRHSYSKGSDSFTEMLDKMFDEYTLERAIEYLKYIGREDYITKITKKRIVYEKIN